MTQNNFLTADIENLRQLIEKGQQDLAYLQNIMSLLPGHVYWQDRNSIFLGCNNLQAQSAGLKHWKEIVGTTPYDYLRKEHADKIIANNNEIMGSGQAKLFEEAATYVDGKERVFLSHKLPLRNANGEVIGLLGVSLDITQQKTLEQELSIAKARAEQAEATLSSIIALMPGHVYWKDKQGRYLGANDLQAKSCGFKSRHEIVGVNDYAIIPPDHAEKVIAIDQQVMEAGENLIVEEFVKLPDGSEKTFLSHKGPLYDQNNKIVGIQGVSLDITTHKKLEQELHIAKQQMQTTLENVISLMPGYVFWRDKNGMFLGCNDLSAQALGFSSSQEIVGKTLSELVPADQADALMAIDHSIIETGIPQTVEEQWVCSDGKLGTYLTQKVPLKDAKGKIIGILGIAFDITERKHYELELSEAKQKAELANQIKTDFLANMSHDLRTPLNGILGFANILQIRPHYSEQEEYIQNIQKCGTILLQLIEDILDYAKLEADRFALNFSTFDLRKTVADLHSMLNPQANAKQLILKVNYIKKLPNLIQSDEKVIRRIIQNLLNNAIKFTHEGQVDLSVNFLNLSKQAQSILEIQVKDTGIGIPKDKLTYIFDRFSRLEPAYRGRYQGLGLGLTIVKEFIEKLQGTIEVQSEEQCGSTFICRVPVAVA